MDFQPSADQESLQQGIRAFCEARLAEPELRKLEAAGGFTRALWGELAELGIFQLRLPDEKGGLGLGAADAVLVFEELGRALAPGPIAWTQIAAPLVDGAADGEVVVGGLDLFTPSNEPLLVEHAAALDVLLVLREDGVHRIDAAKLDGQPVATPLDPLTPLLHCESLPDAERIAGPDEARRLRLEGAGLAAAQLLGISEATLAIALAHAREREQFGRTIGSFQAIKHMLADMFARQELARASVYAAGSTLDHPEVGNVEQAVRGAKIVAGDAAMKNARTCIQIHGGMGYTWEVLDHFYLKRTWVLESSFGASEEHSDGIAEILSSAPAEAAHAR